RPMRPWPAAYTWLHQSGKPPVRLAVQRTVPSSAPEGVWVATPGRWLPPDGADRRLLVAAVGGAVEVLELQPAGKRRMTADEFLRGRHLQPDDWFGPESGAPSA